MLSTTVVILVCLCEVAFSMLIWGVLLRAGLRWTKTPDVTPRRILRTALVVLVLQTSINCLMFLVLAFDPTKLNLLTVAEFAIVAAVQSAVIARMFRIPFKTAVRAWLPTILLTFVAAALSLFLIQPVFFQSFTAPTNSMAPTLLGPHMESVCPECGSPNYGSAALDRYERTMICENFHMNTGAVKGNVVHQQDRFLVCKFLSPKRWDMVVFEFPEDPSQLYVKRLVGLPGETVQIEDGFVWINGVRQTPPDSISEIRYLSGSDDSFQRQSLSSSSSPAVLGPDEYFVLGDFTAESWDSRLWQTGAANHNPFAVPESHMKGVVTHTLWPLNRLRIHR